MGDDVRDIDWNVTARTRKPHIKVYEEERELTMMLVVDVSGSGVFGSGDKEKREVMTEIAAVLAFSAAQNNDKVGCLLFSDRVEKFIPPKKGRSHILQIIRTLLDFEPQSQGTSLEEPLKYLTGALKKRCTTFLLSDFCNQSTTEEQWSGLEKSLKIASSKHDIVAVRVYDKRDAELPDEKMKAMLKKAKLPPTYFGQFCFNVVQRGSKNPLIMKTLFEAMDIISPNQNNVTVNATPIIIGGEDELK